MGAGITEATEERRSIEGLGEDASTSGIFMTMLLDGGKVAKCEVDVP